MFQHLDALKCAIKVENYLLSDDEHIFMRNNTERVSEKDPISVHNGNNVMLWPEYLLIPLISSHSAPIVIRGSLLHMKVDLQNERVLFQLNLSISLSKPVTV